MQDIHTGLADIPDNWQHADIDRVVKLVQGRKLAIDCGAHRGVVTQRLLDYFERVVAIEPTDLADQITGAEVIKKAVADVSGTVSMMPGKHNTGQSYCVTGNTVDVITLDGLSLAPDFIKIDTEGMEYFVLLGAAKTLAAHRPVVMLEMNGLHRRYGIPDDATDSYLVSLGAKRVMIIENNGDEDWVYTW